MAADIGFNMTVAIWCGNQACPFVSELHGLGSPINCRGRRVTSCTTRDAKDIARMLAMVP